jgi:hypothetical protein
MKKLFKYIENLWVGRDRKPSLKSVMAIAICINLMINVSHAVNKWDAGRSMADLALVLGIEAGLIAALLGLTTYSNIQHRMIDKKKDEDIDPEGPTE